MAQLTRDVVKLSEAPDRSKVKVNVLEYSPRMYAHVSDSIAQLPVKNVDPEVVAHGADWIAWAGKHLQHHKQQRALAAERQELENQALYSGAETFLRLWMDDPGAFSPVDRTRLQDEGLVELERRLRTDDVEMSELTNRLLAENVRLRSVLAKRYGREFKSFK